MLIAGHMFMRAGGVLRRPWLWVLAISVAEVVEGVLSSQQPILNSL